MTKRMLIDDTHPEETRIVVIDGNRLEDVEFESSSRKQIKGNVYLAKIMRIEPSLQAAFVDYGGNRHGFLAFGEIHPDYYNVSKKDLAEIEKEVDDIIEGKKQSIKDRESFRNNIKEEKEQHNAQKETVEENKTSEEAVAADENSEEKTETTERERPRNRNNRRYPRRNTRSDRYNNKSSEENSTEENKSTNNVEVAKVETAKEVEVISKPISEDKKDEPANKNASKRLVKKAYKGKKSEAGTVEETDKKEKELKVLTEDSGTKTETISEDLSYKKNKRNNQDDNGNDYNDNNEDDIDEDDEQEFNLELQRKLLISRKLFHKSRIQDVLKEGQTVLVQIAKEERGNKGAALTTYLSLAGRYCVLMPNRIKSGGVSRKITNGSDRKRLKTILKELPLNVDMSMIVRTAGEDKSQAEITRDYNYLIRSWGLIKTGALKSKAPCLIHEEASLIKRALRDMYTKDISEVVVDGANAYKNAKDFIKILSPQSLKKIKTCRNNDIPLFQRFQVEGQLEKLHDTTVQLESGGYLVINPTEALVAIDVNSGRSTKERDLEETALKTNLEAADEIARQLRLRNLAGLVVIDFIDMEDNSNNNAVEKRVKEALKKDRSRVQVGKMSCFGLIEISRQRMHPSFFETSYEVCPHCLGKGIIRTTESCVISILRDIESEGIKNRYSNINVFVPSDVAIYLLNQKRSVLTALEIKYNMSIIISADDNIKNISNYKIERTKSQRSRDEVVVTPEVEAAPEVQEEDNVYFDGNTSNNNHNSNGNNNPNANGNNNANRNNNHNNRNNPRYERNNDNRKRFDKRNDNHYKKRYEGNNERREENSDNKKEKSSWWKKLIGG